VAVSQALAVDHDASSLPAAPLDQDDHAEGRLALSSGQLSADWGWMPA
jgi:hypothetical protein